MNEDHQPREPEHPGDHHGDATEKRHRGGHRDHRAHEATDPAHTSAESATATHEDVAQLKSELEDARTKGQSYLDLAQRTQADFVNYKRRIEQERSDFARASRAEVVLKVLPALDDLTRAVAHLPPDLQGSDWAQGVVLIERKLRNAIEALGVKPLDVLGKPFDPWQEEALMHEPSAEHAAETVTGVVREGYALDGKVIRPAQVIVSSGPPENDGK